MVARLTCLVVRTAQRTPSSHRQRKRPLPSSGSTVSEQVRRVTQHGAYRRVFERRAGRAGYAYVAFKFQTDVLE